MPSEERNRKRNIVIREIFGCIKFGRHQGYIEGAVMPIWSDFKVGWNMGEKKRLAGVANGGSRSHKPFYDKARCRVLDVVLISSGPNMRRAVDQCIWHVLDLLIGAFCTWSIAIS